MAQPLYRVVAPPPDTPAASSMLPRQKKDLQKQYRDKESECFSTLRDVINQLTGEELQKRQEILRKAIDLLSNASEVSKLRDAQSVHPASHQTGALAIGNVTSAPMGHSSESSSSHWPQGWQSTVEPDAQFAYYAHQSHGERQHLMFDPDAAFNQASSLGFSEDWSGYYYPENVPIRRT